MSKRLLDKRREHEAAEARKGTGEEAPKKKAAKAPRKAAATTRKKRTKEKVAQRKRLMWAVFSGSMKEEGRFPYDQRAAAEEKAEQLRAKSKKMYFIQPVKEVMADAPPIAEKADAE